MTPATFNFAVALLESVVGDVYYKGGKEETDTLINSWADGYVQYCEEQLKV